MTLSDTVLLSREENPGHKRVNRKGSGAYKPNHILPNPQTVQTVGNLSSDTGRICSQCHHVFRCSGMPIDLGSLEDAWWHAL